MIVRNIALASIVAAPLLVLLWLPGAARLRISFLVAWYLLRDTPSGEPIDFELESPFSFRAAASFGAIYLGITVISVLAQEMFGEPGVLAAAYLGGLVSSAAVSVLETGGRARRFLHRSCDLETVPTAFLWPVVVLPALGSALVRWTGTPETPTGGWLTTASAVRLGYSIPALTAFGVATERFDRDRASVARVTSRRPGGIARLVAETPRRRRAAAVLVHGLRALLTVSAAVLVVHVGWRLLAVLDATDTPGHVIAVAVGRYASLAVPHQAGLAVGGAVAAGLC
jgi:uncharacterized membrane protein (DUF4010 family)